MRRRALSAGVASVAILAILASGASASEVQPNSHDYGSTTVGSNSPAVSFTLLTSANYCTYSADGITCTTWTPYTTDTSALGGNPGATTRSGDFLIHNTDCPYQSYPAPPATTAYGSGFPGICHFEVSFAPLAAGLRSLTLAFPDTSGYNGSLNLTGAGLGGGDVRAAAIKKCKKKFPKGSSRRKKCLRHARQLPA